MKKKIELKIKKLKMKYKSFLIVKLSLARKENKFLKEKVTNAILDEQKYIDKISLMQNEIRQLKLKLNEK